MINFAGTEFSSLVHSVADGTQPAAAWGTSLTPAQNAYPASYTTVLAGASNTADSFGIIITINSSATSASARDMLFAIGTDPAGGTAYADFILHLCAPCPSAMNTANNAGGITFYFPVFIKAGTSIGAKCSVNNATLSTARIAITLQCGPTRPLSMGRSIVTYGAVTASSRGTAVTPGTASEGAWVELGTVAAGVYHNFWQLSVGCNSGTMENALLHADLGIGDATTKRVILQNVPIITTSVEATQANYRGAYGQANPGDKIYGRLQQSGTLDVYSMAAHGVVSPFTIAAF